ncbi:MAG: Gfo/Idh/MocA family oxidoreductase [Candidatus Scalindua rubra]|uniref:1-carboxy-3-chloro-3,4-dihydroxycyclohexa-1, 5-diene dehydrogenase n=1 Tax=Candidatus Scalindua brodae TaxID=237368 RepID=A0A0B0EQD5_9BACT|nr:MAG: 1-carboxy-3-chloro-3,4-dihydroxycyclohexa-1, 5-diene dehydrogenase [Candidatus Scalindua brodae]MBZ0109652.1 Gfo/Idh/MocA family oxidoreductase [Candidatus Scalindua rubra]TWU33093.1 Inositol 2-dehydrogenase [Candidatus Brocadiaceae bacterium S225]
MSIIKDKLRVGIAGYGVVGERRRVFIDRHPKLETIAVCDQKFSNSGIMHDGLRCYKDFKHLLEEPIDMLFVSLPNYLAPQVTIAGLERGIHVFCEKPPGRSISDIESVIEAENRNHSLCLKYGFNHRYHYSVIDALEIVKSGEMGEIINILGVYGKSKIVPFVGEWRSERKYSGGGILLDQGIHMVDLISLFCDEFKEVKSFVSNQYWGLDVEDNAYALMKDINGRVAVIHSSATQWQHRFRLEITLSDGYLELQGILAGSKSYGEEKLIIGKRCGKSHTGTDREEIITYLEDNSWRDEINEFADAICNGKEILHGTSSEALNTMKLVYRIYWADPEWRNKFNISNPD